MANKRLSKNGASVVVTGRLSIEDNEILENLIKTTGKRKSELLRIGIQLLQDSSELEITKLEEEIIQIKLLLNSKEAKLARKKASVQQEQAVGQKREELIEKIVLKCSKGRNWSPKKGPIWESEDMRFLKAHVELANRKLNGDGEPIQVKEMINMINQRIEAKNTGEVKS